MPLMKSKITTITSFAPRLFFNPCLPQDGHHRTPFSEGELDLIQGDEDGKKKPGGTMEITEDDGN